MIDLGTLADLLEHDHELAAYYGSCDRWSVLPLAELVAQGKGSPRHRIRVCRKAKRPRRGRLLRVRW